MVRVAKTLFHVIEWPAWLSLHVTLVVWIFHVSTILSWCLHVNWVVTCCYLTPFAPVVTQVSAACCCVVYLQSLFRKQHLLQCRERSVSVASRHDAGTGNTVINSHLLFTFLYFSRALRLPGHLVTLLSTTNDNILDLVTLFFTNKHKYKYKWEFVERGLQLIQGC